MKTESVSIATSGKTINRFDRCPACDNGMLFRMHGERVVATLCGWMPCENFLREFPEPPPEPGGGE